MGTRTKVGSPSAGSIRRPGVEWRVAAWAARHPASVMVPGTGVYAAQSVGVPVLAGALGGAALGLTAWRRGHPDSFDALAAPRIRSLRRRWFSRYAGRWWQDVALSCDLAPMHRRTGQIRYPRVIRVRSWTPSIDTVWVRLVPGQSVAQWEARAAELAEALGAVRVAVERVRPQVVGLVVERADPFGEVIDAPDMPWDADMVDLGAVWLGETELGADWCEPLAGQHWLVAGATGSGKNSLTWAPLRSIAPLVRDGLVRCWFVDPKRMELSRGRSMAHRYACEPDGCVDLIEEYATDLRDTQRRLAAQGVRKFTPSPDTPVNLLVLDELAALLAFGDHARVVRRLLSEIGTQGRGTGHSLLGYVQEPSKDVVPVRDLFTVRICLRATAAAHVDMVLGDGARLRGALADEIPNTPDTAGIGFVVRPRSRVPIRVRAAYVEDHEVDELVAFTTQKSGKPEQPLRVVS
jgi:DNA segregation ATPase FtsK/SpoIIIE, S-DNA-T family